MAGVRASSTRERPRGEDPVSYPLFPTPPPRALAISLLALVVAAAINLLSTEGAEEYAGLVWILALIPLFLLSYHKGWPGSALACAIVMVVFTGVEVVAEPLLGEAVDWWLYGIVTGVFVAVTLGTGVVTELLHRRLSGAFRMAYEDPLTGLPSRRAVDFFLSRQIAAAERGQRVSVVFFDIDGFKRFNDLYGHAAGDEALRRVGLRMLENTRAMGLTGRYGGEEFVSVLPREEREGAKVFAERVREAVASLDLQGGYACTVSAGIATYRDAEETESDLLDLADRALYHAKSRGGNCVVTYEEAQEGGDRRRESGSAG